MAKRQTQKFRPPHPQPNPYSVRYYHLVMWQEGEVIRHSTVGVSIFGNLEMTARRDLQIPNNAQILTERVW